MICYSSLNDQQLRTLIKIGDHRAFTEIYDRYWENLYQHAFSIMQDRELSLDVLQEIFVWLWDNRQGLQVNSFEAYLKMAVRYKIANYIRHDKVKMHVFKTITQNAADADAYSDTSSIAALELKELRLVIDQFTEQLPNRCKAVFHLSRNEWLSNPEIAQKLQVSEKTVENQLTIALKKLRIHLAKYAHFLFFFF